MKLQGKKALITGAGRGLGKAMALALAREGAHVILVSRSVDQLNQVAAEAGNASVFAADVTKEADVARLAEQAGSIDILINNAGINIRKNLVEFTLDEWNSVIDTNLTSVFLMCRAFVPGMKGKGYGRIINLTSIMSHVSIPGRSAYSSSKTALLGLTRALALELSHDDVTVNGISPGPFATELNTPILSDPVKNAEFVARIPVGRWGKVEEIGELAVYLCSAEAGFITGTDILIDGGWTAQ